MGIVEVCLTQTDHVQPDNRPDTSDRNHGRNYLVLKLSLLMAVGFFATRCAPQTWTPRPNVVTEAQRIQEARGAAKTPEIMPTYIPPNSTPISVEQLLKTAGYTFYKTLNIFDITDRSIPVHTSPDQEIDPEYEIKGGQLTLLYYIEVDGVRWYICPDLPRNRVLYILHQDLVNK